MGKGCCTQFRSWGNAVVHSSDHDAMLLYTVQIMMQCCCAMCTVQIMLHGCFTHFRSWGNAVVHSLDHDAMLLYTVHIMLQCLWTQFRSCCNVCEHSSIMMQCLWTQFNHDAMFVNTVQSWCYVVVHSSDQDAMFMSIVQIMMQWFINSSEHVIDMFYTLLKSRCNVCELSSNHEAMYQCRCTHFRTRLYNISSGKER